MFTIIPLKGGIDNVLGFYCGATNVGMRLKPINPETSLPDGDVSFIRSSSLCDVSAKFTTNRFAPLPLHTSTDIQKILKPILSLSMLKMQMQ